MRPPIAFALSAAPPLTQFCVAPVQRVRYDSAMERPFKERTTHGHLVSIWMHLSDRRARKTRAQVEAYLAGPEFLESFQALDPARRVLALQAAGAALERAVVVPAASGPRVVEVPIRVSWTEERKEQLRQAARRLPDDRAIARELGLSPNAAKVARWKYVGPKRSTPHISRRGPIQIAA